MSSEVAALEAEVREYRLQLETVQSGLQADPSNAELLNLKQELEEVITLTSTAIAELKPASAAPSQPARRATDARGPAQPVKEKWSKENHPAFQPGYRRAGAPANEPEPPTPTAEEHAESSSYTVNDMVLARWKSGDKSFYPAKITSITGSSSKPVYIVTWKNFSGTETLFALDIKPLSSHSAGQGQKRKADGTPTPSSNGLAAPPATSSATPGVISAAPSIDADLASAAKRAEPSKVGDGPPRPAKAPRKVKANKELEAGKNKWQEFAAKGKSGKAAGARKDSMFRTGDGVNARVGFTGSGGGMRKDQDRRRHIYDKDGEDE